MAEKENLDITTCIGQSEDDAVSKIKEGKFVCFVARRDDEKFNKTMDYRQDRINIEIEAGLVVSAAIG